MEIKYWAGTDVGRKRSDNEDNFLIDKRLKLFVVADGMGGHASGEIASAMAVHGIREIIDRERDIFDTYDDDDPKSHVEVCTLLEYAVHHTCAQIHQKARREPEKRGMGTTLVVLLFIGARGFIAYVGDSRIYLLRGGIVYQLTEDHSLRNELIRMGKITAEEFESSPYANLKNAMTRAVGVYESVEVDTLDFDVIPGDSFLLCSDGLYEYLSDEDIAHAIGLPEIREVPGMLIDSANTRGGKDNITAVVVQVAGDDSDSDRAAELNFTLDTLKNVPLFRELSYQQLVRVMNLSKQSAVAAGQMLFEEGQPGNELHVVLRGRVELTRDGVRVAEVETGAHLGEMSLIDEAMRSATATALEPGKILTIERDDFYDVLRREPALAVKLLWSFVRVLADRLRRTTADLATARTSAGDVPDLTDELAEDAARSAAHLRLLASAQELEDRKTLVSGTVVAPAPDAPTRAEPQSPPEAAPAPKPAPKPAPRIDPRRTLISTTTSNVAPASDEPKPEPAPPDSPTTGNTVVAAAPLPPRAPSGSSPAASPPAAPRPSTPVATAPSEAAVPPSPPPARPAPARTAPGSAAVPPAPPPSPNTGDTVVPPSRPRRPSGPVPRDPSATMPAPGGMIPTAPTPSRGSTAPAEGPATPVPPPARAGDVTAPKRSRRRATLPQMPGTPPGISPPPVDQRVTAPRPAVPPVVDPAARGNTAPTPAVPLADSDAPKRPATRRVAAAPQANPGQPRVAAPPAVPPPPPATKRKNGSVPPPPDESSGEGEGH